MLHRCASLKNLKLYGTPLLILAFLSLIRISYYWIDPYDRGASNIVYGVIMPLLLFGIVCEGTSRPKLVYTIFCILGVIGDNVHGNSPVVQLWRAAVSDVYESVQALFQAPYFIYNCVEFVAMLIWWVFIGIAGLKMLYVLQNSPSCDP